MRDHRTTKTRGKRHTIGRIHASCLSRKPSGVRPASRANHGPAPAGLKICRRLPDLSADGGQSVTVINWSKPSDPGNDGKTLVSVDLSEIQHTPMAALPAAKPSEFHLCNTFRETAPAGMSSSISSLQDFCMVSSVKGDCLSVSGAATRRRMGCSAAPVYADQRQGINDEDRRVGNVSIICHAEHCIRR